ncbi:hypothetical protein ACC675_37805, partial [Rhizobium ruizarguesonis]
SFSSGKVSDAKVERDKGAGLGILSNPDFLVLRTGKDAVTTTPEILAFLDGGAGADMGEVGHGFLRSEGILEGLVDRYLRR